MTKIIFLDIDGVLNGHDYCEELGSTTIWRQCVDYLNQIIDATGAKIVVSSAWRYMVWNGAMTIKGFEYMLKTHGIKADVVGITCRDEEVEERSQQIEQWIFEHDLKSWVVLDDLDLTVECFVRTIGDAGLVPEDVTAAIALLNDEPRCMESET